MQSRAIPQRFTNQFGFTQFGNPFQQNAYKPNILGMAFNATLNAYAPNVSAFLGANAQKDTSSMFKEIATNRVSSGGNVTSNINARLQSVIEGGATPPVLTLADAVRLSPGLSVDDVKSSFAELGYEYVPTSQGGILRNVGGEGQGNSPGQGYTFSNGAWHAPAGQDPYSDIKSVHYSRSRGYVTPEVARLLNRQRYRRRSVNRENAQQAATQGQQNSQNVTQEGLVNFRASFG